jgi:hypothetical protein
MSRFLDPGSTGTNGVSLVVNGMEVSNLGVSASAIKEIKINQDPYSAEYMRPGRGRIEMTTKPGSPNTTALSTSPSATRALTRATPSP